MRTALLILSLLIVSATPTVVIAQEEAQVLNESDFELTRYQPQHVDANALLRTIHSIYGRRLDFADRKVDNLTILNDDLVIYETAERTKLIYLAIEQLDRGVEVPPQEDEPQPSKEVTQDDMEFSSYSPKYFEVNDFYNLAADLYGRQILVGDSWHENFRMMINNNKIVIYEEKAELPLLIHRLRALDNSQAPEENAGSVLTTAEYTPRHVSAKGLMRGIQSFQTSVPQGRSGRSRNANITLAEESGMIVIRDYPSEVEEILAALKRLDQPVPQVMLTCFVVHGVNQGESVHGKPAEQKLQDQLKQVLPFDFFELNALGLMRAAALAGTKLSLEMDNAAKLESTYNLRMEIGAYDAKTGALSLEECTFSATTPETGGRGLFTTSTTIYKGEYAVLGVTGTDPIFLVLQVHPIDVKE